MTVIAPVAPPPPSHPHARFPTIRCLMLVTASFLQSLVTKKIPTVSTTATVVVLLLISSFFTANARDGADKNNGVSYGGDMIAVLLCVRCFFSWGISLI